MTGLAHAGLTVNRPGDRYEQEADRVARRVLSAGSSGPIESAGLQIQRYSGGEPRTARFASPSVSRTLSGLGRPLDRAIRMDMDQRFGHDFSQVRIHDASDDARSAREIQAQAYTVGSDIVFGPGRFAPNTWDGKRLLAHELTHVIQQGAGAGVVQRQEEEDLRPARDRLPVEEPTIPQPDLVADSRAQREPRCPATPTRLGNLAPVPPCNEEGEDIAGEVYNFCADSDVFVNPGDLPRLRSWVSRQPSGTSFKVRTYSSTEGPGSAANAALYNSNLSCHRLNRMIRELLNLGVREQQIDGASMGPTDQFGRGRDQPKNRRAVLQAVVPQRPAAVDATGLTMSQIRDAAKERLANGGYPLAVDAYFALWTCGRWRTLAEAVTRTHVLIEGSETTVGAGDELGTTSGTGENTIVISRRLADATDPIGATANRIADLTFHHFSRPVLANFEDQHRVGMHLVYLAGLPQCTIPLDPMAVNVEIRSRPNPADPFPGRIPSCADQPLPGPLTPQRGPASMETAPSFTVSSFTLSGSSGPVVPAPTRNPFTVNVEPVSAFNIDATVDAAGAAASIANYDVGFVQTVMSEEWVNTHVDGRRERQRLPLPLRDGAPRNHPLSDPPWFDRNTRRTAAPGPNQLTLIDAPNFRAFRFLPDLPSSVFVRTQTLPRPGGGRPIAIEQTMFDPRLGPLLAANTPRDQVEAERRRRAPLANNVPDTGHRVIEFNTWVVARRKNAPATLGATQFLHGARLTFRLNTDWRPVTGGHIEGTGSYSLRSRAATDADAASVVLRGATPGDFIGANGVPLFAEYLEIEAALPRASASGLIRTAYFNEVRRIALPHRTDPTMRAELVLRINVDVNTGRVILDTPDLQRGVIRVLDDRFNEISSPAARTFARAIFPEIRKLVVAPGLAPNEPQSGVLPVAVRLPRLGAGATP